MFWREKARVNVRESILAKVCDVLWCERVGMEELKLVWRDAVVDVVVSE